MSWNEKGELSEDARYDLLQLHKEAQKLSTDWLLQSAMLKMIIQTLGGITTTKKLSAL
jgi:hypothetical protein